MTRLLGWRPSLEGWRPLLLGRRPSLLGRSHLFILAAKALPFAPGAVPKPSAAAGRGGGHPAIRWTSPAAVSDGHRRHRWDMGCGHSAWTNEIPWVPLGSFPQEGEEKKKRIRFENGRAMSRVQGLCSKKPVVHTMHMQVLSGSDASSRTPRARASPKPVLQLCHSESGKLCPH